MASKMRFLSSVENWNSFFEWGSLILIAGTVLFGAGAILTSRIIKDKQEASIGEANTKAAEANKAAAEANERAAILDKKAAEARLELAKIDPINLPIRSIRADVWLVVRGKFFEAHFNNDPVGKGGATGSSFSIFGKDGALVIMRCSEFETAIWLEEGKPTGRTFKMSFTWPSGDWMEALDFKYWIDRNNASTSILDAEMLAASIDIPPIEGDSADILQSSCVVTINGSIRRKFSVPKRFEWKKGIFCAPIKD